MAEGESMGQAGRGLASVPFQGEWRPETLAAVMGDFDMSATKSGATTVRWEKPSGTKEAYPLVVDTKVDSDRGRLTLRGFVFDEDGRTRLSLDGDDGVTHHAKSGALGDFENILDTLGNALSGVGDSVVAAGDALPEVVGMPSFESNAEQSPQAQDMSRMATQSVPQPATYQQESRGQPQWGMPVTQQVPQTPQAPSQYAPYQQPVTRPQQQYPQYPSQPVATSQPPVQSPSANQRQFGYGAENPARQQTASQGVAPGWAVQSVPDRCWMFIAISCVELILLMAESTYINPIVSLIPIALLSWPAIPAIVYSFAYKKAFQQGNAQLAMAKMRLAKGWIIGAGIWCLVRVLLKLAFCSYY